MVCAVKFGRALIALALASCASEPARAGRWQQDGSQASDPEEVPSGDEDREASDDHDGLSGVDARVPDAHPAKMRDEGMPCEVANILGEHCLACHGAVPSFGAPVSLSAREAFLRPAASDPSRAVYEVAQERVNAQGAERMPPSSWPALSTQELAVLSVWLDAGAQASIEGCVPELPSSPSHADVPSAGGSGGARKEPIDYRDPELTCYRFRAFAPEDRGRPFDVPTTPDLYVDFTMRAPWKGTQYIRSFRSVTDNQQVIHHWILYKNHVASAEAVELGIGSHPDAERLVGWAPGSDDLYFDPDVGMRAESDVTYTLEAHYNNTTGSATPDASGVEVCVTPKKPEHEVVETWVGTDLILGDSEVTGTCTPVNTEPVHIIAAHPHMHLRGRHMKVVVQRKDGPSETIFDRDFDFGYQRSYLMDVLINPGDIINTTCTYSEPVFFGLGTEDEMCYFFPVSWPAGALVSAPGNEWNELYGANTCLE